MGDRQPYGWGGTVGDYLSQPPTLVLSALETHLLNLMGCHASSSQQNAWREEEALLRGALRDLAIARPEVTGWGLALEYELHLEGGRRPDAILHSGGSIFVLEFKQASVAPTGAADQVIAYARDLAEYHQATHGLPVEPVLVLTNTSMVSSWADGLAVLGPSQLAAFLDGSSASGDIDFQTWLDSPYEPLPTLVEAARMIFREEPLPRIRRAESAGIPEAVNLLVRLTKEAQRDSLRSLAMLAGVPGAGKTLAGLSLVYDRLADDHDAVFLSGNGPLVQVLRDALQSKTFVQDLHAFITTYGTSTRLPDHHIVVFDEAQRAWDAGYMAWKGRGVASEPDLLVEIGERLPHWCALVGLVGDGQEIHSGEEAGIQQWQTALTREASLAWRVHCPPRLAPAFEGQDVTEHEDLDLTISLRSRRADDLHAWVAALLDGRLGDAAKLAASVQRRGFPMYVSRDLERCKAYLRERYLGEPERRYGIIASSKSQRFLPPYGVDSSWPATKKVNFAHWYNRERGQAGAGSNLDAVVTEFGCQGLELDMPLVAWGDDVLWSGRAWKVKPGRPQYPQEDPVQLRLNCYRVLLTRGRDGLLVFLPDDRSVDLTEHALLAAGLSPLPALLT
ncbi:hypothetical protein ASG91_00205 [Phycicoccus sp. Soil802]|nr:hypothetical protein ASG91_00205 [Phycicoccus sp. Soil802]